MDKMRFTKEAYERTTLLITEFDKEDVIATSTFEDELDTLGRNTGGRGMLQDH